MRYYQTGYRLGGTKAEPSFEPVGVADLPPGWGSIDYRPDSTVLGGFCLVAVPDGTTLKGGTLLASARDEPLGATTKRAFGNATGLNFIGTKFNELVLELFTQHSTPVFDKSRWNPLQNTSGRTQIWLGPGAPIVDFPAVVNTTTTESFTHADQNPWLLTADQTWTKVAGDPGQILTNRFVTNNAAGTLGRFRLGADLATNNNYAQIKIIDSDATNSNVYQACARYQSGADTTYRFRQGDASTLNNTNITKLVAATSTTLASSTHTKAANDVIRVEANGSTINGLFNGVTNTTVSDSSFSTGLRGGYQFQCSSGVDLTFDLFEMGDLPVTATARPPMWRPQVAVQRGTW